MQSSYRHGCRCAAVALLCCRGGFQWLVAPCYLLLSGTDSLLSCAVPFFLQLEPLGEKTIYEQLQAAIVIKCPNDVSYKGVCVCVELLGVAGSLCEPGALSLPCMFCATVTSSSMSSPPWEGGQACPRSKLPHSHMLHLAKT